jgi:Zn-finger nucleic acid-binding protein
MSSATMNCPACAVPLGMSVREGIEIDYCPSCRGVWLDRGELDKIIERSGAAPLAEREGERTRGRERDHDDDTGWRPGRPHQSRRRTSFLEELFD